ncbi:MAG: NAD(P)-dependent glycerol-3-phosphate dehydrogenase [Burkholderiales bacterium]|nr:NAD(P)-dependent glycerol-3-phosphate dehydrogenase [Burkholderiales bacterium]
MKLAVLGAGAWGTAFALAQLARHAVTLWSWKPAQAEALCTARRNTLLPAVALPDALAITADLDEALDGCDLVVVATPTAGLAGTCAALAACGARRPVVWLCKGFEAGTGRFPHQVVDAALPPGTHGAALSGPSFADEVAAGRPAAVTVASRDAAFAQTLSQTLSTARLRVYSSTDLIGVEVGGAVKNVIAIAAGVADGLDAGLSARAALVTRGLAEITRLGVRLGGRTETFLGLSGAGDLILTATGDLSRNRRVGLALARGTALDAALADLGHVAEGVPTAREVRRLAAQHAVDMPITDAVCRLLDGEIGAAQAAEALLRRDPAAEQRGY